MVTTFTVLQVAEHIDAKVRDAWDSQFWVRGEVSGLNRATSGRVYFDLVHPGKDGRILARLGVSIRPSKARLVDRRLAAAGQPLTDGIEVRIKASLSFWVGGGRLSLDLADIDPAHTAGALAVARRELLSVLWADGSMTRNAALPLPALPLRLGLITSAGSQAFHDLHDELRRSALPFEVLLADTRVQGRDAPGGICAALSVLGRQRAVDLVLLTRGGGADADLMTFDHADVARAIAGCPRPVWTGIGHHLDAPVAEKVAAKALKTPTALAQAVVAHVRETVDRTEATWQGIRQRAIDRLRVADRRVAMAARRVTVARGALGTARARLDGHDHRLDRVALRPLAVAETVLDDRAERLQRGAVGALRHRVEAVDRADRLVDLADPDRLIARGWSVTTDAGSGALVTGPVPAGTRLRTRTRGGVIDSEVVAADG